MNISVSFPQYEYSYDPFALKDFIQTIEGLGYSGVLAYDHVLGANPDRPGGWDGIYTYKHGFLEPFLLFAFWAGMTTKLEFVTGVIILPQRQTALVAKQAATLDVLCKGRLRLGVGVGWNKVEYDGLGYDFHKRGRRIEEQVHLLRKLWTEPLVTFKGEWDMIPDAGINPLPVQRPIPIWFGGDADVVLQRIAQIGDGWISTGTVEETHTAIGKLLSYLLEENRSKEQVGIEGWLHYGDGNPDTWKRQYEDWKAIGATHINFSTIESGLPTPQAHLDAMMLFAETIGLS